jgi:hypothetical protein
VDCRGKGATGLAARTIPSGSGLGFASIFRGVPASVPAADNHMTVPERTSPEQEKSIPKRVAHELHKNCKAHCSAVFKSPIFRTGHTIDSHAGCDLG